MPRRSGPAQQRGRRTLGAGTVAHPQQSELRTISVTAPGERVPDGREPDFHLPLPLVLWGTAGIVAASALFTLWTSMRLRRLEKLACESTTGG